MQKKFLGAVAAGIMALGLSTGAHAALILVGSETHEHLPGVTSDPTPWSDLFTFSQYSGAAPLAVVELILHGTSTTTLTLNNFSGSPVNVSGSVGAEIEATVSINSLMITTLPFSPFGPTVVPASGSEVIGPLNGSDTDIAILSTPAAVLPFIGFGTFDVAIDADGTLTLTGGGGNIGALQETVAYGAFTVNYYTETDEIPEPASLALLGLGLAGLGLLRRRKH